MTPFPQFPTNPRPGQSPGTGRGAPPAQEPAAAPRPCSQSPEAGASRRVGTKVGFKLFESC